MVSTRDDKVEESPAKRIKLDGDLISKGDSLLHAGERRNGVAPVKPEYLVYPTGSKKDPTKPTVDDDAAEASIHADERNQSDVRKKRSKAKGRNTSRDFGSSRDILPLCSTRVLAPEFSPPDCPYGDKCRFEHNLRKYLAEGKRKDIDTLENGLCPVYEAHGLCPAGFKCRFAGSHTEERVLEDGRKELVLKEDASRKASFLNHSGGVDRGTVNVVSSKQKINLNKRKVKTPKSDQYIEWLDVNFREMKKHFHTSKEALEEQKAADTATDSPTDPSISKEENRAMYTEPPFLPSEKRRIYYGPETPILAPLTTQGNLPFRRLCVESGAAITFSEMAMSIPLLQGLKPEWALLKAHYAETTPPSLEAKGSVVQGYDNAKDLKFGAQICATTPWQAIKATEVLHQHCPHLRVIDLNCGCPIDMVYKAGGGSALLDNPGKLEKIVRGMNTVSGEIPVTTKIRMGTLTDRPTALKLVERLTLGGHESQEIGLSPCGVAAITLHGRSRQQRYTKLADWEYISECAALIKRTKEKAMSITDTLREGNARNQPNGNKGFPYMIGNGDCYSHVDYFEHLQEAKVDSVMIARGALIKPWIFEEIKLGQYLDKSASQRLDLIKDYVKYGLDSWGSDEMGVGLTRRFLLEWLSFAHRYVPIGLLEYLPPKLQDRPPAFKGRSDLETLLASDDFKDWIKISEMFLGPAHKDFRFEPKHKSNSYEIDAEG